MDAVTHVRTRHQLTAKLASDGAAQLEMAAALHEAKSLQLYKLWGHKSLEELVTKECQFSVATAQRLLRVYEKYVSELEVKPERLHELGWAKIKLVAPVIDRDNLEHVLTDLKRFSYKQLRSKYRHALRRKKRIVDPVEFDSSTTVPADPPPADPVPPQRSGPLIGGNRPSSWLRPAPAPVEFYVDPDVWEQLCYAVHHECWVLLTGPAGCGKTELSGRVAAASGFSLEAFNLGAMTEPRTTLIGNTHFDPVRGTWFAESRFVRAIRTPGTVVLLDEISRAGRDAFNLLLPLLDGQRYLALDEHEEGRIVKLAEQVMFIATANLGMEFTGADPLDKALKERFAVQVAIDFPPEERELALLRHRCPGISASDAGRLVKLAMRQREMARDGEFVELISTRSLIGAARQIAAGIAPDKAVRFCIFNQFPADGGEVSERVKVAQIFQKE